MASCARLLLVAVSLLFASSAAATPVAETDAASAWARLTGDPASAALLGPALADLGLALQGVPPGEDPVAVAELVLRETLLARGADSDGVARLVPQLVVRLVPGRPFARSLGGPSVPIAIGPFELTRAQILDMVGARSGRSRTAVIAALHQADPVAAASLDDAELQSLVPRLVELAEDRVLAPPDLLLRFRSALGEGAAQ
jgi:hypothetical protein